MGNTFAKLCRGCILGIEVNRIVVARNGRKKFNLPGSHETAVVSGVPEINFVKGKIGDLCGVGRAVLLMLLFNTVNVPHGARVAG